MKKQILLISAAALAGCTATNKETSVGASVGTSGVPGIASIGPNPEQSRAAVDTFIHSRFHDPYSVQDLKIANPVFNHNATIHKDWVIVFSCNAKNSFGAYIGVQRYYVLWKDGQIDWQAIDDPGRAFLRGMLEGAGGYVTM
jgi:hypothetical protein